jgi:hypothetical protein
MRMMPFLLNFQLLAQPGAVCHLFAATYAQIKLARYSNIVNEAPIRGMLWIGKQGSDG